MDNGQAARLFASQQLRVRARGARRDARETRRAVACTRERLRLDSLPLRVLAVRRMSRVGGPDAGFWIGQAVAPGGGGCREAMDRQDRIGGPLAGLDVAPA